MENMIGSLWTSFLCKRFLLDFKANSKLMQPTLIFAFKQYSAHGSRWFWTKQEDGDGATRHKDRLNKPGPKMTGKINSEN